MTFAEEKTFEYIRRNYRRFHHIPVLEILPYLSCLTTSDQVSQGVAAVRLGAGLRNSEPHPSQSQLLPSLLSNPLPVLASFLTFRMKCGSGCLSIFAGLPLVLFWCSAQQYGSGCLKFLGSGPQTNVFCFCF